MKRNDIFNTDSFFGEETTLNTTQKSDYTPMSYEEAASQRANRKTPYNIPDYSFPELNNAAHIIKIISAVIAIVFIVFTALAYITHGGVFLLKKTPATITNVEEYYEFVYSEDGTHTEKRYKMTLTYEHNGSQETMYGVSSTPKYKDGTVFVYVSKLNSYSVWYIDGPYTVVSFAAIAISICVALFVASTLLENYGRNKLNHDLNLMSRIQ